MAVANGFSGTVEDWLASLEGVAENVQMRVSGGFVQYKHVSEVTWNNLVSLASLTGPAGATGNFLVLTAGDPVPGGTLDGTIIYDATAVADTAGVIGTAGSAGANGVLNFNTAFTRSASVGQYIVGGYVASGEGNIVDALTITDTKGNTYTVDAQSANSATAVQTAIFSARITTPLTTSDALNISVTNTAAGANKQRLGCGLYLAKGLVNPGRVDRVISGNGINATLQTIGPTAATTTASEIVFAVTGTTSVVTAWTEAGAGYSPELAFATTGSAARQGHLRYKVIAATGTQTAQSTTDVQCTWAGTIVTYKGN